MEPNQILVLALASVPTMITVLVGILINNSRMTDLSIRVTNLENKVDTRVGGLEDKFDTRLGGLGDKFDARVGSLEYKFDQRFDMLLGKVVDIDNRLTRMEAQQH